LQDKERDPWFESMDLQIPVFVYGTLMSGNSTRGLNMFPGTQLVGKAETKNANFSLWDLGNFPAVSTRGDNKIQGEVWNVSQETFDTLDQIEGYPNFYTRQQVETTQGKAWMYYIPDVTEYQGVDQITGKGTVKWERS
tara:strand:+ start:155 stop:568 length:414 start_codon:yes stop_codon:yes gene_type:complete